VKYHYKKKTKESGTPDPSGKSQHTYSSKVPNNSLKKLILNKISNEKKYQKTFVGKPDFIINNYQFILFFERNKIS